MCERIHPHWIETEGGQPVKVRAAKKQQTVWRWPAALVGIFVVGTIIAAPFINFSTLFGQVAPVSGVVEVRIRNGQFVPEFITVQQGEQVTWFNDDDTPHSIESDTLCNSQNACLVTPTILRGESTFLLVPDDVSSGEYTYTSSTNPTMIGRINIEESALTFDTPLTEVASAPIETASPLPSSTSNENSIPAFAAETQRT